MYGALIGGPDQSDNYTDQRSNYTQNEPADDYNAGFIGALARLYSEYGGAPLTTQFPPRDIPTEQFCLMAKINQSGPIFTEIDAFLFNNTNEPARVCHTLSYKYFYNFSEVIAAGIPVSSLVVTTAYLESNAKLSALTPYKGSDSIYYLEISYYNDSLFPGTQDSYKREAQFRVSLPQNSDSSAWNPSNDWSYLTVGKTSLDTCINVPIYDNEVQIWGAEPGQAPISSVRKAAPPPALQSPFVKVGVRGEKMFVSMTPGRSAELSIFNIQGKQLFKTFFTGSFAMDARKLGRGACFAVVKTDGGTFISKVMNLRE
jgi:endoglucanase